jgi:hypothetical protein
MAAHDRQGGEDIGVGRQVHEVLLVALVQTPAVSLFYEQARSGNL